MKPEEIPWRGYRVRGADESVVRGEERLQTQIFMTLRRLLGLWADDRDRLAVAVYAFCWLGYNPVGEEVASAWNEVSFRRYCEEHPGSFDVHSKAPHMDDSEGWERVEAALRGRRERDLRNRAKGLLFALEVTAPGHEFSVLHEIQVEAAVIECRKLLIEERIAKLRSESKAPESSELVGFLYGTTEESNA